MYCLGNSVIWVGFQYIFLLIQYIWCVFSRFLEYLLRKQPPMLQDTKRLFFRVLNLAKDESSKNYLKGLLDLLFDKDRKD